ncbi:hypothetical protein COOONC_18884, partial [Cooperia oncophora]
MAPLRNAVQDHTPQYAAGWTKYEATPDSSPPSAYRYRTPDELQGTPIEGHFRTYEAGGYCVLLQGPTANLISTLQQLQADNWIDK